MWGAKVKQYRIVAYADRERGFKQQEVTISAENEDIGVWKKRKIIQT